MTLTENCCILRVAIVVMVLWVQPGYGVRLQCIDVCSMQPDPGSSCSVDKPKSGTNWAYSLTTRKCEKLFYNGCGGNGNNFEKKVDCENFCLDDPACSSPSETGPCKAEIQRWFFDKEAGKCQRFTYGGCNPNLNNYESEESCQSRCICSLPQDTGNTCPTARKPRKSFYFNNDTGCCEELGFKGCDGNANNFERRSQCQDMCDPKQKCKQ